MSEIQIGDRVQARRINGQIITGTWRGPLGGDRSGFDLLEDTDCLNLPRCAVLPESVQPLQPEQGMLLQVEVRSSQFGEEVVVRPSDSSCNPCPESTIGNVETADAALEDVRQDSISDSSCNPCVEPTIGTIGNSVQFDPLGTGNEGVEGTIGNYRKASGRFKNFWHKVYEYQSHGSWYFRYSWGRGAKVERNIHINGGNIRSALARANAEKIRQAIADGLEPQDIEGLLG